LLFLESRLYRQKNVIPKMMKQNQKDEIQS